jgi:hypothetical protein
VVPILLLALGAGAFALARNSSAGKLPPGQNPFDSYPLGVNSAAPILVEDFTGSSGHTYKVTAFAAADGRTYFVAEKRGDIDWCSYFVSPNGHARALVTINADEHAEIAEMLADFQLAGGAVT